MSIETRTVTRIAHLARLNIPEAEQEKIANDLGKILDWVAQLDEVSLEGIEPLSSVHDMALRRREDVVNDGGRPDDILANAPAKTAGFFTVPKVVE